MPEFSPDELAGFGREAAKPFMQIEKVLKRQNWSFCKTTCYARVIESADKNWVLGVMCLVFRSGVAAVIVEFWQCYEGEGAHGLDERFDIGKAVFSTGLDDNTVYSIAEYLEKAKKIMESGDPRLFFTTTHDRFVLAFKDIKAAEKPILEPEVEQAVNQLMPRSV